MQSAKRIPNIIYLGQMYTYTYVYEICIVCVYSICILIVFIRMEDF